MADGGEATAAGGEAADGGYGSGLRLQMGQGLGGNLRLGGQGGFQLDPGVPGM